MGVQLPSQHHLLSSLNHLPRMTYGRSDSVAERRRVSVSGTVRILFTLIGLEKVLSALMAGDTFSFSYLRSTTVFAADNRSALGGTDSWSFTSSESDEELRQIVNLT